MHSIVVCPETLLPSSVAAERRRRGVEGRGKREDEEREDGGEKRVWRREVRSALSNGVKRARGKGAVKSRRERREKERTTTSTTSATTREGRRSGNVNLRLRTASRNADRPSSTERSQSRASPPRPTRRELQTILQSLPAATSAEASLRSAEGRSWRSRLQKRRPYRRLRSGGGRLQSCGTRMRQIREEERDLGGGKRTELEADNHEDQPRVLEHEQ